MDGNPLRTTPKAGHVTGLWPILCAPLYTCLSGVVGWEMNTFPGRPCPTPPDPRCPDSGAKRVPQGAPPPPKHTHIRTASRVILPVSKSDSAVFPEFLSLYVYPPYETHCLCNASLAHLGHPPLCDAAPPGTGEI